LYLADHDTNGLNELYVVSLLDSNVTKVNPSLANGGTINHWQWSPDSSMVSYVADQLTQGVFNLYTSNVDGSNQRVVNTTLPAGGRFAQVIWTPDSSRLVFAADMSTLSRVELYSVRANGTQLAKLNSDFSSGQSLPTNDAWLLSPDGNVVLYRANQAQNNRYDLFTVGVDGSQSPARLNANLVSGGNIVSFSWSADSTRVMYIADQEQDEINELFLASVGNSTVTKVNQALTSDGDVSEFAWAEPN